MFTWLRHRGHSARWVITTDGGWSKLCSCGATLIHHPGGEEMSKAIRLRGFNGR